MADWVVIGADGMLGRCWEELLVARGIDHVTTTIEDLDITDAGAVAQVVQPGVSWVVNCAAYTFVDAAEEHEALANEVNGYAVGRMAERCKAVGAKLLHYSTDYVFDGTATEPYRPDHPRHPVNAYGRSKAIGEELIARSGVEHLLVRSSWLYAPWGQNFVLHHARARKKPRQPTSRRRSAGTADGQPQAGRGEPAARRERLPRDLSCHRRRRVHLGRIGVAGRSGRQSGLHGRALHERGVSAASAEAGV